ncbi:putative integral membrane protein [Theileria parva strain Muguga]|uniref:Uncharacterized protein n=1 Tax=Theileria parva TaxID=5875 RepID=Q4N1S5_THEPA|nr:putative integral membrane protein [Theileria parva strain Muguga]EAN32007.1 putative integral membrane protein [Theileria parva strain Muguga]|eukprot:XP_764290.1 hypothetical protein [Theileria parva strain Muguga]
MSDKSVKKVETAENDSIIHKAPDIILAFVCLATYFLETELSFISLYFLETLHIPHIHLGIYNSKLNCYRSIFIILGCLTEYGIYKICDRFKLEKKYQSYRECLISRTETIDHFLMVKAHFWICTILSITSLILWPLYLYHYHEPSKQYDQYIFFVKTKINSLVSVLKESVQIIGVVNKKLDDMDKLKSDGKDEINEETTISSEQKDPYTEIDSTGTEKPDTVDEINDKTIQKRELKDSRTDNDLITTENGNPNDRDKFKNEVITLLNRINYSKMTSDITKTKDKIDEMVSYYNKNVEMSLLLNKEIHSLIKLSNDIKILKSEIDKVKDQLFEKIQVLKQKLNELKTKINSLIYRTNELDGEIKKIVHNNFLWTLSPFLMIIPTTLIYHFLFDGTLPHGVLNDEDSKHNVILTSTAHFIGTIPAFCMASKGLSYRFWTWQHSLFWVALVPEIIVFVFSILAIQSKIFFFKSFIDSTPKIGIMTSVLGFCHGLMESTSFVSVSNHVHFHSAHPDDFYLVLINIILQTYLKIIALKLSASYNEARISLGYHLPEFYTFLDVQPLEGFKLTLKETFRRFLYDLLFDIRVNINQFI